MSNIKLNKNKNKKKHMAIYIRLNVKLNKFKSNIKFTKVKFT